MQDLQILERITPRSYGQNVQAWCRDVSKELPGMSLSRVHNIYYGRSQLTDLERNLLRELKLKHRQLSLRLEEHINGTT